MNRDGQIDIASSYTATVNHHSPEEEYFLAESRIETVLAPKETTLSEITDSEKLSPAQLDKLYSEPLQSFRKPDQAAKLVSIIIPCFNCEEYIARAVRSVLAQTYSNLEVLVVDDGSTDASVSIANEIAEMDPRVKVVALLRNFGCYYARNIGIMYSRGALIGICDSDDILSPDRLSQQVAALESNPAALACLGRIRRWTKDFDRPLGELQYGENSLLWSRAILEDIGWYDSCRYGADSEFRERLIEKYGREAIVFIDSELYFLRTSEVSLTMTEASSAYSEVNGKVEKRLSPTRLLYRNNFRAWHAASRDSAFMPFPLMLRPFELGGVEQNASKSLAQRCIGSMASYPERRESLRLALPHLLKQLDELVLYLNDYDEIPDFCYHPKLTVILGGTALGDLRDNGKFYRLPVDDDSYVFTLDDDIIYPEDYVRRMVHYIEVLDRKAVVGVHGVDFADGDFSELKQRAVRAFWKESSGAFVDLLGTGTTAWHSSALKPVLQDFATKGVCDLWFARIATASRIPLFSVPRESSWLLKIEGSDESLWAEANERPDGYFSVWKSQLAPLIRSVRLRVQALEDLNERYPEASINAAFGPACPSRWEKIPIVQRFGAVSKPLIARKHRNIAIAVGALYVLVLLVGAKLMWEAWL